MAPILLAGAFGQRNPGDEALLAAFCHALGPDALIVTSQDPAATEREHGVTAMVPSATNVAAWLRRGRHLVVGGGTVFKTLHPTSGRRPHSLLLRTLAITRAARSRGITVSMVGVGAGRLPTPRARRLARAVATHADLLVLRDEESATVLAEAGVPTPLRVGADPAWTLFDTPFDDLTLRRDPRSTPEPEAGSLLVALSHHAGGPDLDHHLAAAITASRSVTRVELQPWQHDDAAHDRQLAHSVATRLAALRPDLPVTIAEAPHDLHQAAAHTTHHALVLGLRFHALLAAAAVGTPFVAVAHEPKLAGLATRFDQIWVPPHASPAVLGHAIDRGFSRPAPERTVARLEAARAAEAFGLLRLVLTGGAEVTTTHARLALSSGSATW